LTIKASVRPGAQELPLGAIPRNLPHTYKTRFRGGLTESQVFRRLQNMIGDRPTDNRNDGTVSKQSILTMVTSTLMMLILHLKDLIINANIVNIEKSNKAEK